jgi:hypothetical protein
MVSGLDDWIYWHFYWNYNQLWQLTINACLRLAPFLTGPRASSTVTNDERRIPSDRTEWRMTTHLRTNSSQSQSHVTTDGQPASLSWNKAPIWGLWPDLDYCLTIAGLLVWGALSDERTSPFSSPPTTHRENRIATTVSCHSVVTGTCLPNRCLANGLVSCYSLQRERDYRTVAQQRSSGSTIPALRRCLPNRCLAMVIFFTISFIARQCL